MHHVHNLYAPKPEELEARMYRSELYVKTSDL